MRIAICFGFVGLSFLTLAGFTLLPRIQAAEETLPDRRVSASPTTIQPKLAASYGKLPLGFEANHGQTDPQVRFMASGAGYTIFLTDGEAVLILKKPPVVSGQSSVGKRQKPENRSQGSGEGAGLRTTDNIHRPMDSVLRMRLVGANASTAVVGTDELPGKSNYFIGNDPRKWRTNVPSYARVKYKGVYPGVGLVYYGN